MSDPPKTMRVPGKCPEAPVWLNYLRAWYDQQIVRQMHAIVRAAHSYRERHGVWPTRRQLIDRTVPHIRTSEQFEEALYGLCALGVPPCIFTKRNPRGSVTTHIGWTDELTEFGTPEGVTFSWMRSDGELESVHELHAMLGRPSLPGYLDDKMEPVGRIPTVRVEP